MARLRNIKNFKQLQSEVKKGFRRSAVGQAYKSHDQFGRRNLEKVIRNTVDLTYRDKLANSPETYDPVGYESQKLRKERRAQIEELALSMAQVGLTIATKNPRVGKVVGTGFGTYRRIQQSKSRGKYGTTTSYKQYDNGRKYARPAYRKSTVYKRSGRK